MPSRWVRQGQITCLPQDHPWWVSHAQLPVVLPVDERLWRVFVAGRDAANRGNILRLELDPGDGMRLLSVSGPRLVGFGAPGAFDRDGLGVTSVIETGGRWLFASAGMNATDHAPYRIAIGLMESGDGGNTLRRLRDAPVLGPGPDNPAGCSSGQILRLGGRWHLWFSSWRGWSETPGAPPEPRYDIRHAVSDDLRHWQQDPAPALALAGPGEGGLARPWVMPRAGGGFEMWYSIRGRFDPADPAVRRYALGYATSADGQRWIRRDAAHVFVNPPAPGDWDHEMQCYASVVRGGGRSYMFYCGNGYGRDGFGYAIREESDAP